MLRPTTASAAVCSATRPSLHRKRPDRAANAVKRLISVVGPLGTVLSEARSATADELLKMSTDLQYPSAKLQAAAADASAALPSDLAQVLSDFPWLLPLGALLLVGVPVLLVSRGGGGGSSVQALSATQVFEALEEEGTVLLDIRSKESKGQYGSPDLSSLKKSVINVPYTKTVKGEYIVDETFLEKLDKVKGLSEDSVVALLDSFGTESPEVAKLIKEGVAKVLYVKDGAEGPAGWKESELPWKEPVRFPLLSLPNLGVSLDSFAEDLKAAPTAGKAALAVGAITAGSLVLFQEIGTVLEVVGLLAAGNFALNKLVFAKDRQALSNDLKTLVEEKIAVKEVGEDVKKIASKLLDTEQKVERKAASKAKQVVQSVKEGAQDAKEDLKKVGKELVATEQEAEKVIVDKLPPIEEPSPPSPSANGASNGANGAAFKGAPSASREARNWIENWKRKQATATLK